MARPILDVLYGEPGGTEADRRAGGLRLAGPVILALMVLVLGVYLPPHLRDALAGATLSLGGVVP
jgi:hypothetical protein